MSRCAARPTAWPLTPCSTPSGSRRRRHVRQQTAAAAPPPAPAAAATSRRRSSKLAVLAGLPCAQSRFPVASKNGLHHGRHASLLPPLLADAARSFCRRAAPPCRSPALAKLAEMDSVALPDNFCIIESPESVKDFATLQVGRDVRLGTVRQWTGCQQACWPRRPGCRGVGGGASRRQPARPADRQRALLLRRSHID